MRPLLGSKALLAAVAPGGAGVPVPPCTTVARRQDMSRSGAAFYAGIGPILTHFELDLRNCALVRQSETELPQNLMYAWPHSSLPIAYAGLSSRVHRDNVGTNHFASALSLDPRTGTPSLLGEPVRVPHRMVHLTTDNPTEHLVLAYNKPAGLASIRIKQDGTLGEMVQQRPDLDVGIFPHQVRITPDNKYCISVARGNPPIKGWWAAKGNQTDPGFLKIFGYKDGVYGDLTTVTVDDGYNFGPRHMDFHPTGPWVYVSLETQNEVVVFERDEDGMIKPDPVQRFSSLADPEVLVHHGLGTVHVHPRGHVVYFANRGHQKMPVKPYRDGRMIVPCEAENSIVVYAIDRRTGKLTEIQRISSAGICPRTFNLDPTCRMLVCTNSETHLVCDGHGGLREQPKNFTTYAVADDGTLEFRHHYDIDLKPGLNITWGGILPY
jgi:6-phosphogluconolactonase